MLFRIVQVSLLLVGIFSPLFSGAQLCTGSLGLPIVNITFGNGANPGQALPSASTSYPFVNNDCPIDGNYTIRNNTTNCFSGTWHDLTTDHTGDVNGYFMLVNASVLPGAFYLDTVRGLCAGTTFEFAAWVVNVLKQSACGGNGIRPNLTFTIERTDGIVIQTYNSGDIPSLASPTWQQYGFFFTTPAGITDVVLRIVNNAPGGCGNDLALDDITFRPCGPSINSGINGTSNSNLTFCEGTATNIVFSSTISTGYTNPVFQWQESINGGAFSDISGATLVSYTKNFGGVGSGNYRYRMVVAESGNLNNAGCRVLSAVLTINVNAIPITTTTSNSPICANNDLQLTATGGSQYSWSGQNGFTASGGTVLINSVQTSFTGKYYVVVTNPAGCSNLDSATVVVNPSPKAIVSFPSISVCEGDPAQLSASGGGTYEWSPATGLSSTTIPNPSVSTISTINYRLIVTNAFNCKDTAFSEVVVLKSPVVNAGPDREAVLGFPVTLEGSVVGDDINYFWSPPLYLNNTMEIQPIVTAPEGVYTYRLTATSNAGCGSDFDEVNVTVYKGLYIPTAFTPNNDGKNDVWRIPALSFYPDFQLSLFNRYGERILYSKNQQVEWDGTYKGNPQPAGVYIYMLSLNHDGENKFFKGTVTLIR